MNQTKISIIIPVYNNEKYIAKCITSLVNQTYRNLEIILVNDGSTDNSLNVCEEIAKSDDRIIVKNKENGGASSARNMGLEMATGEFIGFIDSDDYIARDMYEKLFIALKSNDAEIAECGYFIVDKQDSMIQEVRLNPDVIDDIYTNSYNHITRTNTEHVVWNKLYKRTLFKDIQFPIYSYSEDYVVNTKISYICHKRVTIGDCLYYYVANEASMSKQPFRSSSLDILKAAKEAFLYHKDRYGDLCPYIAVYYCDSAVMVYIGLSGTNYANKRQLIKELVKDYRFYFSMINRKVYRKVRSSHRYMHYVFFRFSPLFYKYMIKFFQVVRDNRLKLFGKS